MTKYRRNLSKHSGDAFCKYVAFILLKLSEPKTTLRLLGHLYMENCGVIGCLNINSYNLCQAMFNIN